LNLQIPPTHAPVTHGLAWQSSFELQIEPGISQLYLSNGAFEGLTLGVKDGCVVGKVDGSNEGAEDGIEEGLTIAAGVDGLGFFLVGF